MLMRKIFTTILTLAMASGAAQALEPSLTVVYSEGEPTVYAIADMKRIEVGETGITVVTKSAAVDLALSDFKRLELGLSDITGLTDAELQSMGFAIVDGIINVTNAPASAQVNVYSMSGMLVFASQCDSDGNATINASSLPTGAYVMIINKFTKKFIIR